MKISLYIDERLWLRFKEAVLRKHGTLRRLSNEIEEVIRSCLVEDYLESFFKEMVKASFSIEELKKNRLKPSGPSSEILIREMRGSLIETLP